MPDAVVVGRMTTDGDGDDPEADGTDALAPDDAFALLGDGTRVGILRALWEAHRPYESSALPFSALFDRVDVEDTGNFNYHLGRLTGHFVRRTAEGYELAAPGFEVVRAVVAGAATETPTLGPTVVGATCGLCGAPVEVRHEDGTTWARCTDCPGSWPGDDGTLLGFGLPPEGLRGRDPDGVLAATMTYSIHRFESMLEGVCPSCGGPVDGSLAVCDDHDAGEGRCASCGYRHLGVLTLVCGSCKFAWRSPSWAAIHRHPALVAFYHDRGVEHVPSTWEGMVRGFDWREELRSTDPPALSVTVPGDGDELRLGLDATGSVVDVAVRTDADTAESGFDPGSDLDR
jgi:hypothetical protein